MADIKITPTNLQGNLTAKLSTTTVQQVTVKNTPPSLINLDRAIILRGEVQSSRQDGTAEIKTQRGTVTVKAEQTLQQGQKIDIQISSGTPPREAIVQTQDISRPQQPQTTQISQPQTTPQNIQQSPQSSQTSALPQTTNTPITTQQQTTQTNVTTQTDAVKTLQQTAQQATQTLLNKTPIAQKGNDVQHQSSTQTNTPPTNNVVTTPQLKIGQAIRLTALPGNLQTPASLQTLPNTPLSILLSQITPTATKQAAILPNSINSTLQTQLPSTNILLTSSQTTGTQATINALNITLNTTAQTANSQQILQPISAKSSSLLPATLQTNVNNLISENVTIQNNANNLAASKPVLSTPNTLPDLRVISLQTPTSTNGISTPIIAQQGNNFTISSIIQNPISTAPQLQAGQILGVATGQVTQNGNPVIAIQTNMTTNTGISQPTSSLSIPQSPQFFALNYPANNISKGTQIILQPTTPTSINVAQALTPMNAQSMPMGQIGQSWPVLQETLDFLLSQLPAAQGQSLLNALPRPAAAGFQFTAAAMIFIAAARGGDLAGWMGGRADAMLKGSSNINDKDNLASKLLRDLSTMTGRTSTSVDAPSFIQNTPDWRGYTLPMLFGMDMTRLNLWVKPYDDEQEDTNIIENKKNLRFIFDVNLSRMGNVILDGLIQPYAGRLDLTLKAQQDFTPIARQAMRGLWHNALTQIEMHGDLDFQTT
jgi:hypothetical protein